MAVALDKIIKGFTFLNEDLADPRTKDLFLIGNLWYTPSLIIFYIYFVNVLGPKFMEKRQPYKLNRIIQIYNVLQIISNLYIFYLALNLMWLTNYNFQCEPVDFSYAPRAIQISRMFWYYFLLKIVDWLDTIFFVLRKKQSQVSFLHVYHHFGMVMASWVGVKYFPGGHSSLLGLLNTFVHSIMYTYYLLSSMKINTRSWKKNITQLQMIQFFMLAWHYSKLLWTDCGYPQWVAAVMIPQNVFMFVLFGEFYYDTYVKPANVPALPKIKANDVLARGLVSNGKLKEQ
ncbi:PREDICTED: elongation of very long chain fatty acids protein AAEL008004-like [Dinoponera quadriceps]|uniref:Elongation of very long chain fatty acids protein n=1 Tax=Dinoponera quadriceps TaxID=609295 RepID=A0A6P3XJC1_DINQU|nr:PREDICTED: elongation of very long chain fatty acids protein AAEL008004-like [Dinoponera quadriceps]